MLKFIFLLNTAVLGIIFIVSGLFTGLSYRALKLLSGHYFDLLLFMILLICAILFYLTFLFLVIGYYKFLLCRIKEKECVISLNEYKKDLYKQILRAFLDSIITTFISPTTFIYGGFLKKILLLKIGKNSIITGSIYNPELVEIGDDTTIGIDSIILGHVRNGDILTFRKVKIGNNCTVGTKSLIMPGVEVGDNSVIGAGAIVLEDYKIPPNEIWGGIPARKLSIVRNK